MKINEIVLTENRIAVGDSFGIELGDLLIETGVVGFMPDGVIVESDSAVFNFLKQHGMLDTKMVFTESRMAEVDTIFQNLARGERGITDVMNNPENAEEKYASTILQDMFDEVVMDYDLDPRLDQDKIMDVLTDRIHDEYIEDDGDDDAGINPPIVQEAEYQGRKVSLGKPMKGDVKKSKVYVKGPKGNVVKVNFGDKNMRIKKSNPARRKSFRARHNCDNPGPRWKAKYWSCRAW
jgi:hypothetical protein